MSLSLSLSLAGFLSLPLPHSCSLCLWLGVNPVHRRKCVAMLLFHPVTLTHKHSEKRMKCLETQPVLCGISTGRENTAITAEAAGLACSSKQSPEHPATGHQQCITCDTFRLNISSDVAHFSCQYSISLLCRWLEWIVITSCKPRHVQKGDRAPALFQNYSEVPPLGQIAKILWSIKQNAFEL